MKKYFLSFLTLFLISCNGGVSPSSKITSSLTSIVSSDEVSSIISSHEETESSTLLSTKDINKEQEKLERFINNLSLLEGDVQSTNTKIQSSYYYLTDALPLVITVLDTSNMVRYNSSEGQIMVKKGVQSFLNDDNSISSSLNYETQTFYDNDYFYRITDFEDPQEVDQKTTIKFSESAIDINLNIGFPLTEKTNFEYMIQNLDTENIEVFYEGIEDVKDDGIWEYSYGITLLQEGVPTQSITYKNKLFIENSIIKKVEQEYVNNLYAGGIKANWNESLSVSTFNQGERLDFEGTRFDPSLY